MKNIIVFGLGNVFNYFKEIYNQENVNIIALCDNRQDLVGNKINNIEVISIDCIANYDYDYLIITTIYYQAILKQLEDLPGIERSRIIVFSKMEDFISSHIELIDERYRANIIYRALSEKIDYLFMEQNRIGEKQLLLAAQSLILNNKNRKINSLKDVEFKVFSQNGEDGIIQWLIHNVKIKRKIFVEFGVQNYIESNTRFLLMNDNWSGLIIDGSEENISYIKNCEYYWKYDLQAVSRFITRDNINDIIVSAGIEGDIGILSIDIDGNDYWVLESIQCISPNILICEYNSILGEEEAVSVPYDASFVRTSKHYSNLYYGVSLKALCNWADKHNYYFIGCNTAGNNAFFVRKDCISKDRIPDQRGYIESKFSESRDIYGKLNFVRGKERIKTIKDMDIYDLTTGSVKKIKDLFEM